MKRLNILLLFVVILAGLTSCDDFLSAYSQDRVVAKRVSDLDELLLGDVYIKNVVLPYGPTGVRSTGFFNILDDDVNTSASEGQTSKMWGNCLSNIFGYYAWQFRVGSNYNASYFQQDDATWKDLYSRINTVNVILDEITDLPHESNDDRAAYYRVQGEAHFLRGCFFFTLANLYGNAYDPATCATDLCVPLKLTPYVEHDRDKETQFKRATVKEVYSQIVKDLTAAEEFLTRSPQNSGHRLHRASQEAASLLLSRVYLYMQEWKLAEEKADAVTRSQNNALQEFGEWNDEEPFLSRECPEIIFTQGYNHLSTDDIFTAKPGDFCVTRDLYDLYDEKDCRRSCFYGHNALCDSITLTNKYERGDEITHISDVYTLRMAEAYLNKAEAQAMQDKAEACATLDELKSRRIEDYVPQSYTGEALVKEIRDERRRELAFEGHRWFDLRRYAVCHKYPYRKDIVHVFNGCDDYKVSYTEVYVLPAGDPAFTFDLPESVIKFDKVPMEHNPRNEREPLEMPDSDDGTKTEGE